MLFYKRHTLSGSRVGYGPLASYFVPHMVKILIETDISWKDIYWNEIYLVESV